MPVITNIEDLRLLAAADGDVELEIWAANRQAAILAEALGRPVTIARGPSSDGRVGTRTPGRGQPEQRRPSRGARARVTRN